jgi:hypothetical protein
MKNIVLLAILFSFFACRNEVKKTSSVEHKSKLIPNKSADSILSNDIKYINDSILKGRFKLDISRYELENKKKNCYPFALKKEEFYEYPIEGDLILEKQIKNIGDINADGIEDSVFILPSLGWCEEGQSYYFTDNNIPRIQTSSVCCHVESIFSIRDIDEDGGIEIAEYFSSCASNFKNITIRTLKNKHWKEVASFTYYISNGKYEAFKDFDKLYKKVAKKKFKFLEISDRRANGEVVMEWKTITMK